MLLLLLLLPDSAAFLAVRQVRPFARPSPRADVQLTAVSPLDQVDRLVGPLYVALPATLLHRAFVTHTSAGWQPTSVRLALVLLALVDFGPTARRQVADSQAANAATAAAEMPVRARVSQWKMLVRFKVLGELFGLSIAVHRPCAGASVLLLYHIFFWLGGAARVCVDGAGAPVILPPTVAKVILRADIAVCSFASLGALGPTVQLRAAGAALFSAAALFVSLEQVPKALKRLRQPANDQSSNRASGVNDIAEPDGGAGQQPARSTRPRMVAATPTAPEGSAAAARERLYFEQWWPLAFDYLLLTTDY